MITRVLLNKLKWAHGNIQFILINYVLFHILSTVGSEKMTWLTRFHAKNKSSHEDFVNNMSSHKVAPYNRSAIYI